MAHKITFRNLHRDTAYFYVGLIISFSISGIALNHRATWNPREYVVESKEIGVVLPADLSELDEAFVQQLASSWGIENQYKSFRVRGEEVRIYFENAVAFFKTNDGKGELEIIKKTPSVK